jgi:tetratricopeptide (TPR) repeat protein
MQARLTENGRDAAAAVQMADALLRLTRVTGNGGLARRAESALQTVLSSDSENYDVRRMLAAVYLSEHRFRLAAETAARCERANARDSWVYGALGDAHLELGEYDQAFASFDRMATLKPGAGAYARSSYAHELQGDLPGALRLMRMALEATPPQDAESIAWHHAQLGHLLLQMGDLDGAQREFEHAEYSFPGHPYADDGLARVAAARGDFARALEMATARHDGPPTAAEAALSGDVLTALGRTADAERQYALAEAAWETETPDPSRLARFLASRGRHLDRALRVAESAWADRRDIFTADAFAWAAFRNGDLDRALSLMREALRTGSRDRELLYHAAAIAHADRRDDEAMQLVTRALDGSPAFDPVVAPQALALQKELRAAAQMASR